MTDSEILEQIGNLRLILAQQIEGADPHDYARLLTCAGLFIAGMDALLSMRGTGD